MKALSSPSENAHVAACGLFCTNCRAFKKGTCKGCQIAPRFASCSIRACCEGKGLTDCSGCVDFAAPRDYRECRKIDNFISKIFALLFKSDRPGALRMLRDQGLETYLAEKRSSGRM